MFRNGFKYDGPQLQDPWMRYFVESRKYSEELAKEAREHQEARNRAESLPPKYIIHTVHGTFASGAKWIEADSEFGEQLRDALAWRVRIERFRWSGRNDAFARWQAAKELRQHLRTKLRAFPFAHHIVVAHSHGGNVAFWALADEGLSKKILGVVTLATPFLSASYRAGETIIDPGAGLFAALFAFWAVLGFSVYSGLGWELWPWALAALFGVLGILFLGAFATRRMQSFAETVCHEMPKSALTPAQVAVIRVQGDEASAAITGVRLAGTLADLLWGVLSAPLYTRLSNLLNLFDYGGARSAYQRLNEELVRIRLETEDMFPTYRKATPHQLELPLFASRPAPQMPQLPQNPWSELRSTWPYGSTQPRRSADDPDTSWSALAWKSVAQALPMIIIYVIQQGSQLERTIALICLLVYAAPAAFSLATVVIGLPFKLLTSISLFPAGWTLPLAGPYLHLLADSSPPGSWTVTQFEAPNTEGRFSHSEAYQSYQARTFIAQWIKTRARPVNTESS
jgi:hypothetical protein